MTEIRRGRPPGPSKQIPKPANPVPPPQYDRMRAPVWTTSPTAPVRAGALNHKSIESKGFRC